MTQNNKNELNQEALKRCLEALDHSANILIDTDDAGDRYGYIENPEEVIQAVINAALPSEPVGGGLDEALKVLLPPANYRISTIDASIENRARIMFVLNEKEAAEWHLQGETLDNTGKDIRPELYITRIYNGNLTSMLAKIKPTLPKAEAAQGDGWQAIETAPWDKWVLLWWVPVDGNKYAEFPVIAQVCTPRDEKGLQLFDGSKPSKYWADGKENGLERITHWMHLPKGPRQESNKPSLPPSPGEGELLDKLATGFKTCYVVNSLDDENAADVLAAIALQALQPYLREK